MEARNKKLGTKKGVFVFGSIVANLYQYKVIAEPSWNQGTKEPKNSNITHQETKSYAPKKAFLLLVPKSQAYIYTDSQRNQPRTKAPSKQ